MPVACFDTMMDGWSTSLPKGNRLPKSLYAAKKEVEQLWLGHVEYDVCPAGCMIYYKGYIDLEECKFCTAPRTRLPKKRKRRAQGLEEDVVLPFRVKIAEVVCFRDN